MKEIMLKTIGAIIVISAVVLACSEEVHLFEPAKPQIKVSFDENGYWEMPGLRVKLGKDGKTASYYGTNSLYGAFLAGRVAQLRNDMDTASEYYKIVLDKDPDNLTINRTAFVILASTGDIKNAAKYAQKEMNSGEDSIIAPFVVAVNDFTNGNYAQARDDLKSMDAQEVYRSLINPLIYAWTYAGEKNEKAAIESLNNFSDDEALKIIKLFHSAMIYDYLGNQEKAAETYNTIVQKHAKDVTYRLLEVITNFYVRSGNKGMAQQISNRYNDNSALAILLSDIDKQINETSTKSPAIINTPQKGLAEALFNIGTLFRASNASPELAQIYIASSSFLNPEYDVAKIALANLLEDNGYLLQANKYYQSITKKSGSYFIAQLKMIENLNTLEQYDAAEDKLRQLLKEYPDNTQLLSNLGDILNGQNKTAQAIKVYKKAIASLKQENYNSWPIFFSLGVTYDKNDQKEQAEETLQKALKLSKRNPTVLNYLGYGWLSENKNVDEAVQMIMEAYQQYPYEGHIIDSLGWVFFRLGKYDKSILYLEQASDMNPGNAVISDHLGDAYWYVGRRNEAVFQWKHALTLKEDADMVDKNAIKDKIENGLVKNLVLQVENSALLDRLNELSLAEDKSIVSISGGAAK